jgi:hypothetical protein
MKKLITAAVAALLFTVSAVAGTFAPTPYMQNLNNTVADGNQLSANIPKTGMLLLTNAPSKYALIVDGDSLTASTAGQKSWFYWLKQRYPYNQFYSLSNIAVSGTLLTSSGSTNCMTNRFETLVKPWRASLPSDVTPIYALWGGINDLTSMYSTNDAAAKQADLVKLFANARNQGMLLLVCTVSWNKAKLDDPVWLYNHAALNNTIRSYTNWTWCADMSRIYYDISNPNVSSDGLHPVSADVATALAIAIDNVMHGAGTVVFPLEESAGDRFIWQNSSGATLMQVKSSGLYSPNGISTAVPVVDASGWWVGPGFTNRASDVLALLNSATSVAQLKSLLGGGNSPFLYWNPAALTFNVLTNGSWSGNLTLINSGSAAASGVITADAPLAITSGGGSYTLAAGASNTVFLSFAAGTVAGTNVYSLTASGANAPVATITAGITNVPVIPPAIASLSPSSQTISGSVGSPLTVTINIANNGAAGASNLVGAVSTDLGSVTSGSTYSLAPGTSQNITVSYSSATGATNTAHITLADNGGSPTATVTFAVADIPPVPVLAVSPTSLDFGTMVVGTPSTTNKTISVQNAGTGTLTYSASINSPFSIVSGGSASLNSGQSQNLILSYDNTSAGTNSLTLSITGTLSTNITVSAISTNGVPILAVTPNSVSFGTLLSGSPAGTNKTVQVSNAGTGTLTYNASIGAPFTVTAGASGSLTAGQNQNITLYYPNSSASTNSGILAISGTQSTNITVSATTTNSPSSSSTGVTLAEYWKLEEGTGADKVDQVGGKLFRAASATYAIATNGFKGTGIQFTGASQRVTNIDGIVTAGKSWATALWFYPTFTNTTDSILICKAQSTGSNSTNEWGVTWRMSNKQVSFSTFQAGTAQTLYATNGGALTTNVWAFVVVAYDQAGVVNHIWVNGQHDSVARTKTPVNNVYPITIGNYQDGPASYYCKGIIDEVAMFDGVPTQGFVDWMYNSGAGRTYEEIVAYLQQHP